MRGGVLASSPASLGAAKFAFGVQPTIPITNAVPTDTLECTNGANISIFNYLESQGSQEISYFRDNPIVPYSFIYRKDFAFLDEDRAEMLSDSTESSASVFGRWYEGQIRTPKIGPSSNWTSIEWKKKPGDYSINDTTWLDVYGYKQNGERTLLIAQMPSGL